MRKQIPNLITLCNLLCGVFSCLFAYEATLHLAALFICLGIFFDFFDGMAARLLGVASPLGKELDSLADVVTSGVAPGLILYVILAQITDIQWLKYTALLIPLFAAYRLAKFNLDTRQSHSFLGLPAPANALIWVSIALFCRLPYNNNDLFAGTHTTLAIILAIVSLVANILMISEIPMFSLKFNFKDMSWKTNSIQYFFLAGSAVIVVLSIAIHAFWLSISFIIFWYILFSIVTRKHHHAH